MQISFSRIEEDSALMKLRWKGRRIGIEVGTSASFEAFDILIFEGNINIGSQIIDSGFDQLANFAS